MLSLDTLSEEQVLYCTKEIIEVINLYRGKNMTLKPYLNTFKEELSRRFALVGGYVETEGIDYSVLFSSAIELGNVLSMTYSTLLSQHTIPLEEAYKKTGISSPLDMLVYLQAMSPVSYCFSSETTIRFWDIDRKTKQVWNCSSLSEDQIHGLHKQSWSQKAKSLSTWFCVR